MIAREVVCGWEKDNVVDLASLWGILGLASWMLFRWGSLLSFLGLEFFGLGIYVIARDVNTVEVMIEHLHSIFQSVRTANSMFSGAHNPTEV